MLKLQRLQRLLFILFPRRDNSECSPPGTARGRGFSFTFTCKASTEPINHLINQPDDRLRPLIIKSVTRLEAVHEGPGLHGDGGGGGEGEWWGGGWGRGGGSVEEGVDGYGGHVAAVLVLPLRAGQRDGDGSLRTGGHQQKHQETYPVLLF